MSDRIVTTLVSYDEGGMPSGIVVKDIEEFIERTSDVSEILFEKFVVAPFGTPIVAHGNYTDRERYTDTKSTEIIRSELAIGTRLTGKQRDDLIQVIEAVDRRPELLAGMVRVAQQQPEKWVGKVQAEKSRASEDDPAKVVTARWETDRLEGETPPQFISRWYSRWMLPDLTGLTFTDIGRIDPPLRKSLRNHMRRNALPDDFYLPTREEKNTALIELARNGGDLPEDFNGRMRLATAAHRRGTSLRP